MFALKTESIKGRMKQKGAFRKETHVDSHAHRGVTVVTLTYCARQRPAPSGLLLSTWGRRVIGWH